jgi:alpha-galactosidase
MLVYLLVTAMLACVRAASLNVLYTTVTPNGFHNAARGWNSFGLQANPATTPSWTGFNQGNVSVQCDVLSQDSFQSAGYKYCSLDSGWSLNNGDQNGRLLFDPSLFDMPAFAKHLHDKGLLLGVYVLPGAFCSDGDKTILGTDILLSSTFNGNNDGFLRCDFDFTKPGVQVWHNSVIDLFASW